MDLRAVRDLVVDPRRAAGPEQREAYLDELQAHRAEIEAAMDHLARPASWVDRSEAWVDDVLDLAAVVVFQLGEVGGHYARLRRWGETVLALGAGGSVVRRAQLMLRLSELHRVTGSQERSAALVLEACGLLGLPGLTDAQVDELAPVSCHALFCLGGLAVIEGRHDDARELLRHGWTHGGDSDVHLWSLVNYAFVESVEGDHEAALVLDESSIAMAERLGDARCLQAARNNRAVSLHRLGRLDESCAAFTEVLPEILLDNVPDTVLTSAEDFACVLLDLGRDADGTLLLGAASADRARLKVPRTPLQEAEIAASTAAARLRLGGAWPDRLAQGGRLGVLAAAARVLRSR